MIYTPKTKKAMIIAYNAHNGQVDKSGIPYIYHPIHLAEQMNTETECIVALLHDVVEDTNVTFDELEKEFSPEIIEALKLLKFECNVKVYSDSAYVVNSINNKWVYSWKKNNWIKSDKTKAKNIELWEELIRLISFHNVKFIKVKGHADNEYNNRCDKLAVAESKSVK